MNRAFVNFMRQYQMMRQNPRKFFKDNYNVDIPPEIDVNNPNEITQYMLNAGIKSQQEVNAVNNNANNMRSTPFFQQLMNMNVR